MPGPRASQPEHLEQHPENSTLVAQNSIKKGKFGASSQPKNPQKKAAAPTLPDAPQPHPPPPVQGVQTNVITAEAGLCGYLTSAPIKVASQNPHSSGYSVLSPCFGQDREHGPGSLGACPHWDWQKNKKEREE